MLGDQSLGSLLMSAPGLSRHSDGEPYQVILLLSGEAGDVVGLATNEDGRVLGWPHPPYEGDDPDELVDDLERRAETVPIDVDAAARVWWARVSET